jgi:hypothetical protein
MTKDVGGLTLALLTDELAGRPPEVDGDGGACDKRRKLKRPIDSRDSRMPDFMR